MHCLQRRLFLKKMSSLGLPGLLPLNILHPTKNGVQGQNFYDFKTLLSLYHRDKIDNRQNYLTNWLDEQTWHEMTDSFFENVLYKLNLPEGWLVEIGTYKNYSFEKLYTKYGAHRCLGFEAFPYKQHPGVIIKDIRTIKSDYDRPIAFGWNNASNWEGSPRSKLAALQYLTKNIVKDGYLLEDSLPDLPHDIILRDFKVVWQNKSLVLLQRTS